MVRDAISGGLATPEEITAALRPYAHRYGARLGDGAGLITRLLEEAGAPPAPQATAADVFESIADTLRANPNPDPHWTPTKGILAGLPSPIIGISGLSAAAAAAAAGLEGSQKDMMNRMAAAGTLPSNLLRGLDKNFLDHLVNPNGLSAAQMSAGIAGLTDAAIKARTRRAIEPAKPDDEDQAHGAIESGAGNGASE